MKRQGKSIPLEEAASAQDQRKHNPGAFEKQKGQCREREMNKREDPVPTGHREVATLDKRESVPEESEWIG